MKLGRRGRYSSEREREEETLEPVPGNPGSGQTEGYKEGDGAQAR